jgi:hypothetical protein
VKSARAVRFYVGPTHPSPHSLTEAKERAVNAPGRNLYVWELRNLGFNAGVSGEGTQSAKAWPLNNPATNNEQCNQPTLGYV